MSDTERTSPSARYRPRQQRKINPLVVCFALCVGAVAAGALAWALLNGGKKDATAPSEAKANSGTKLPTDSPPGNSSTAPTPTKAPTPVQSLPKQRAAEWSAVVSAAGKRADAIKLAGEAEMKIVEVAIAKGAARRLGQMSEFDRQFGLTAAKMVKDRNSLDGLPPEHIKAATEFAPVTVALVRLGKVPPLNTPTVMNAVCANFVALRSADLDGELERHEKSTPNELIEKGLALAVFDRAKPPSAGEFRRLQTAGLQRVAFARAVEAGMGGPDAKPPIWFVIRRTGGSAEAERDLVVTVWAIRGMLPEAVRPTFDVELAAQAKRLDALDREVVTSVAAAVLAHQGQ